MKVFFLPLFLVALLSACGGSVETRVSSSGIAGLSSSPYVWASESRPSTTEWVEAKRLVDERLSARGFAASDDGTLYVEMALASRPATLALVADGKEVIAPAMRRQPFKNCAHNEYRLGIAITRISDGVPLYRASASQYHCEQLLMSVLPQLVDAAIADLGQPRGAYVIKRKLPVLRQ